MFIFICKPVLKKQLSKCSWDIFDMFLLSPARFLFIHNHTTEKYSERFVIYLWNLFLGPLLGLLRSAFVDTVASVE